MPKYSICMTCSNEAETVRQSLNSLLNQLNEDYEVIVVDNFSKDGTYQILREFEDSRKVKVIRRRCSRGLGRQIAFENSSGVYVIANLDLDDIFKPVLNRVVSLYHEKAEGNLMAIYNLSAPSDEWVQNMTIGPRNLIASIGGWRDLNLFEDWDIWSRAGEVHKYCWTTSTFAANEIVHVTPKRAVSRLKQRYERYREWLRLGAKIFRPGEEKGASQRLAYFLARLYVLLRGALQDQAPDFDPLNPALLITLMAGERPLGAGAS